MLPCWANKFCSIPLFFRYTTRKCIIHIRYTGISKYLAFLFIKCIKDQKSCSLININTLYLFRLCIVFDFFNINCNYNYNFFTFWCHFHAGPSLPGLSQPLIGPITDAEGGFITPKPRAVLQREKQKDREECVKILPSNKYTSTLEKDTLPVERSIHPARQKCLFL